MTLSDQQPNMGRAKFTIGVRKLHKRHATIVKMAELLACFSHDRPWLTEQDVAEKLEVHRTTAHRLIRSLCKVGFLEPHYQDRHRYTVGRSLYTLGNLYRETRHYLSEADEVVKTVNQLTGEAVTIIVLDGRFVVTVMREESTHPFRFTFGVGSIQPAHAPAGGKILLAELTDRELQDLFPAEELPSVTPKTVATRTSLKRQLDEARRRGVATNIEESCEGLACVASAIRDEDGRALAALGIAAPVFTLESSKVESLAELVARAASLISYRLGYDHGGEQLRSVDELQVWWRDRSQTKDREEAESH